MTNREKVKNALRRCESYDDCEDIGCPYYYTVDCLEQLRKEALVLLEVQEKEIENGDELLKLLKKAREEIKWLRGMLKKQEEQIKKRDEQIKKRDESLEKAREEIKWLRGMLKKQETIEGTIEETRG